RYGATSASGCTGSSAGHVTASPTIAVALCFQLDICPGYCWPFQASQSQVVIRLPTQVQPQSLCLLSQGGSCASWSEGEAGRGRRAGPPDAPYTPGVTCLFAMFSLQNELCRAFRFIKLVIQRNWGNSGYTCIYGVQVHRKITGMNVINKARG
ncbi:SUN5 protein, partial [Chunga burmeisteri]|nr:SUN5 protein [Chunga burmeisteri]